MKDEIRIINPADGIRLMNCRTGRFKNTRISVRFAVELDKETVGAYAILGGLMRYSSQKYPDNIAFEKKLASLYGAVLSVSDTKSADTLVINFKIDVIADKFAINNEKISDEGIEFLLDVIFNPDLDENGLFKEKNIAREKRLLLEAIAAENNDKMSYSSKRFEEIMFEGEGAAVSPTGYAEKIEKLTAPDITNAWKNMLCSGEVFICVVGNTDVDEVAGIFKNKFASPKRNVKKVSNYRHKNSGELKEVNEYQNLSQGKLVLGFSSESEDRFANLVMNAVFGGGVNSKLFKIVREKLSLCYYCSSSFMRRKGVVTVKCGIESANKEKAVEEILNQLEAVKSGDFSDEDLSLAKIMLTDIYKALNDSPSNIEGWYGAHITESEILVPEQVIKEVNEVDRQRIIKAAQSVKLDTVYALLGGENND